jgi:hypothetical protein
MESSENTTGTNPNPDPDPTTTVVTRDVNFTAVVTPPDMKLDVQLIIDNSNSMLEDNKKLASRLSNFVSQLQGSSIDWQMCVTVTSTLQVGGSPEWGASVLWANYVPKPGVPSWVLKADTTNLTNIFNDTITSIGAGWNGTDDERGIKAAWWHIWNGDPRYEGNSGCYRNEAALAMIIISDEDERSVGGQASDQYYENEFLPLEELDMPSAFVSAVQDTFGMSKRYTFNSIIVKPGDSACMSNQDASGSKSHYGRKYSELSQLTGGGIGSICDTDYYSSLNYFKDRIETSIEAFPLECLPHNDEITFKINGKTSTTYSLRVEGMKAVFTPALVSGVRLDLAYKCVVD